MAEGLNVAGKRVLVVGLGKSGVAAALFLKELGAQVTVSDSKSEEDWRATSRSCWTAASRLKPATIGSGPSGRRT